MEILKVSQVAKRLNKTRTTIWTYMKSGKLRFHQDRKRAGRYLYWNEVLEDLNITPKQKDKINIAYARVSTKDQLIDLDYQKQALEQYCIKKGKPFQIIEDIGSGINYNKKGLKLLIQSILESKVDTLVLLYNDRLLRFGNELIFHLCEFHHVNVEIINQSKEISKEEELVKNVLEIITVFASKVYGMRSHKTKNIIKTNQELWK